MPSLGFCADLPVRILHNDDWTTPPLLTTATIRLDVITAIHAMEINASTTPRINDRFFVLVPEVALQSSSGFNATAENVRYAT